MRLFKKFHKKEPKPELKDEKEDSYIKQPKHRQRVMPQKKKHAVAKKRRKKI